MNAMRSRTLIRKTSLLRKINPMMRRSSFTKKIIYNPHILQVLPCERRERRNDLEIMNWIPQITLQIQNSDQSPLYDVRNPARASNKDATCEVMFRGRYGLVRRKARRRPLGYAVHRSVPAWPCHAKPEGRSVVEPDGIEPTTSCLQSTRSPS